MHVADLPLAERFVAHFEAQGVEELYPPQVAAVEAGVCEGERVLAAVPTASGKTFVAQLAMLTSDGPAVYVVPLRALATEKYDEFTELPDVSVGIATGDFDATDEDLAEHDIVVATSEKVDSAIRNGAEWISAVDCAVVDEIHLLDQDGRGPTLEVTVAKLRRLTPDIQLVGLSATVGNAAEIADWLDAELVASDWRPVELKTGVYAEETAVFDDGEERDIPTGGDQPAIALARDAVDDGGQCLVFVSSRRSAQALAEDLGDEFLDDAAEVAEELRLLATTGTGTDLARSAANAVAFHHAGLSADQRRVVEDAFRDRELKVIVATPTLAAGVNVPARRVVVRDHERFDGEGMASLPVLEVHQMFGRAGRPHLDPYGEALLVASDAGEADELRGRYVGAEPERVTSKLDSERALRTHVLSTVASGFADSRAEVLDLLDETFYGHQRAADELGSVVGDVLDYLAAAGMLDRRDGLAATRLGTLVSRVYVDPVTGRSVVDAIERAGDLPRVTSLTVLELVCDTSDMPTLYVRNDEAGRVTDAATRREGELTKSVMSFDGDFQRWLDVFKTALMLADWADGVALDELAEQYGVGPGDVGRIAERAAWLLAATESIAGYIADEGGEVERVARVIRETREALVEREA
ncbi:DEAD/DEAH box helicase [Haloarchaeobius litoreus]|uniref:ATP-dependent DNA helicase Hel308 n=1 Tax=Haloarchaeobius litoreus TaxID=755306 RepID=A0ABD6DN46_9EURY|nr:DEAD/DEAH box helicase [Haloarchaeobius litoreus]